MDFKESLVADDKNKLENYIQTCNRFWNFIVDNKMGLFKRPTRAENTPSTSAPTEQTRKKSSISFNSDAVTEASLQVWRGLPSKIRHDPSMVSFQQEEERWKGSIFNLL